MIALRIDDLRQEAFRRALFPLRAILFALTCYGTASSAVAVGQYFGLRLFPVDSGIPGLMFNTTTQGASLALLVVALVVNRLYWFIPALLPGLWLAHSRGGFAALAFGLLATRFRHPLWLLALTLAGGVAFAWNPSVSDLIRLNIWYAAWTQLTFWGNGIGSFEYLYIADRAMHILYPIYVHNDYLQTVYELGVWAIAPFAVAAWALSRTAARDWPILVTFAFIACFSMPLHMGIPLALGAIALATTLTETLNA